MEPRPVDMSHDGGVSCGATCGRNGGDGKRLAVEKADPEIPVGHYGVVGTKHGGARCDVGASRDDS